MIRFVSICSGIEAASCAVKAAGLDWKPVAFCEIEKFPCAVLQHHYPDVPNWGDLTKFEEWPDESVDLVCGGTPCQSFSVAGLRKGMADARGNLALDFVGVVAKYRPRWVLWENVPGVFSSSGGRDFAAFLGGLTGRAVEVPADGWGNSGVIEGIADAYSVAWTVLDAQFFGLAQRRKRVFVVGCLGGWAGAAAVLFDQSCLRGDSAPCRTKGEGTAVGVEFGPSGGRFTDVNPTLDARAKDGPIRNQIGGCVATLTANYATHHGRTAGNNGGVAENQLVPVASPIAFSVKDHGADAGELAPTLRAGGHAASHANGGVMPAVALPVAGKVAGGEFQPLENAECRTPNAKLKSGAQGVECGGAFFAGQGAKAGSVAFDEHISPTLKASDSGTNRTPSIITHSLRAEGFDASEDGTGRGVPLVPVSPNPDVAPCLDANMDRKWGSNQWVNSGQFVFDKPIFATSGQANAAFADDKALALNATNEPPYVAGASWAVRRLTPRECERLQGFPDDYTLIPWRGKAAELCPDGPRYKALGNSWAVPCVAWIFQRIEAVDQILRDEVAP